MKLSMYILADWLKEYHPIVAVQSGKRTLRNVRLFSEDMDMIPSVVYAGPMSDFVDTETANVICVQGRDMLILNTEDANEVFNKIMDAFDYYNQWSDHLKEMVGQGASLQDLLDYSYQILHMPMQIGDPGFYMPAVVGIEDIEGNRNLDTVKKEHTLPFETIMKLNDDDRIRKNNRHAYFYGYEVQGYPTIVRNLFSRHEHIGWLVMLVTRADPDRALYDLVDELGDIIEMWSSENDNSQLESISDKIRNVYIDQEVTARDREALQLVGWYPEDRKILYVVTSVSAHPVLLQLQHQINIFATGVVTNIINDQLVLLLNAKITPEETCDRELVKRLRLSGSYAIRSKSFTNYDDLPGLYRFSCRLLQLNQYETGKVYEAERYSLDYILQLVREDAIIDVRSETLEVLKKYDEKNGTKLFRTLETYLHTGCNYVETARQLGVHRNSVVYRVKEIVELTGIDLNDCRQRLYIELSYLL